MSTDVNTLKADDLKSIRIKNINTHKFSIVFTNNCKITFLSGSESFFVPQNSLLFVERGVKYSCLLEKDDPDCSPFQKVCLDDEILKRLKGILTSVYDYRLDVNKSHRTMTDKIIVAETEKENISFFKKLLDINDTRKKTIKIAYLISKMSVVEKIVHSVVVSSAFSFTDKVRNLLSSDLSRKWRLNFVADVFNVSEITVRKRLEVEGTSFNTLLLELRMNHAMNLLQENEKQIHQISALIGINNPSYFIRLFKDFYGITPKQYVIYFRS